jgi:hypothetical protein
VVAISYLKKVKDFSAVIYSESGLVHRKIEDHNLWLFISFTSVPQFNRIWHEFKHPLHSPMLKLPHSAPADFSE